MKRDSALYDRRRFLKQSIAVAGLAGCSSFLGAARTPVTDGKKKPNFLFLFADDYCYHLIHALGCDEIHTPNLDRLVRNGTSFSNCYNQGGWHGAICVASRTMLLTGRFLWDAQQTEKHLAKENKEGRLWPCYFREDGYRTYMSGKWHVNCDADAVFDVVRNIRPGMPPDIPGQYNRPQEGKADTFDSTDPELGGYYTGGKHWSEVVADDGVTFLQDPARGDAPFFMYLAFNAPHDPRQSPRSFLDLYEPGKIGLPASFQPEYPAKEAIGCGSDLRDERLAPFPRTEMAVRTHRREYYAIISHLDTQIGRVLDALDQTGQTDNTYIIFAADNGLAVGNHGLLGKQNMYEHSMKVPLILCGPNISGAIRSEALVYMQDIMPTTLELAGIPLPKHVAYKSLVPLLNNADATVHEVIYGAYMNVQRMVRIGSLKLIYYPSLGQTLLFDLALDPDERHSLDGDSHYQDDLYRLRTRLNLLEQELHDPLLDIS